MSKIDLTNFLAPTEHLLKEIFFGQKFFTAYFWTPHFGMMVGVTGVKGVSGEKEEKKEK